MSQDFFSNAAKDPAAQSRSPMSGHDHQVDVNLLTYFNDFSGGIKARGYNVGYIESSSVLVLSPAHVISALTRFFSSASSFV